MNTDTIIYMAGAAGAIIAGFFAGLLVVYIFNRLPAEWLTEYGEVPSQELKDPNVKRLKENPWRWVYAAGFACLGVRLVTSCDFPYSLQLTLAGLFACWVMLIIALSDLKYMIIPDQFVLLLALSSIGFMPVSRYMTPIIPVSGFWNSVIGLLIGGGSMLIVAGIGALITRRESVGFGDVKLCAAAGLMLGVSGIIAVLVLAVVAGGLVAVAGLASGKLKRDDAMPLGPYICGSAMAYILIAMPLMIE